MKKESGSQAGIDFYKYKKQEAHDRFSETLANNGSRLDYEVVVALEDMEWADFKLMQLKRRINLGMYD
jgi:hypothetical protein